MESYNCGSLWLASFTQHDIFRVHLCGNRCQYFIPFRRQIIFHGTELPHFVIQSLVDGCLGCFRILAFMHNKGCYEHSCSGFYVDRCFRLCIIYLVYLGVELPGHMASLLYVYFYQFVQLAKAAIIFLVLQTKEARVWKVKKLPRTVEQGSCRAWLQTWVVWLSPRLQCGAVLGRSFCVPAGRH